MSKENNKNLSEESMENVVENTKEVETNNAENKEEVTKIEKVEEVTKVVDDSKEEPELADELKEKEKKEPEAIDEDASIGKRIFASVLDQAILFGLSAIVVVVFALIIKIFGYYIASPVPMLLIAYVVLNILYLPVFELKKGKSIGKRILGIL